MSSAWSPLVGVVLGGLVTGSVTFFVEARRERRARAREERDFDRTLATRWDGKLAEVAAGFVSTTREVLHRARRLDRSPDVEAAKKQLDEAHERLRSLASQLGLVADWDGQRAARDLIRLTYLVRELGEQGAPKAEQDAAHCDVLEAIRKFQVPVRRQLRVPDADRVLGEEEYESITEIPSMEA